MRKMLIALLTAVCLIAIPVSVLAEDAEEKDYSYLEEMSEIDLPDLDAAIHEILGDGGSASGEDRMVPVTIFRSKSIGRIYWIRDFI